MTTTTHHEFLLQYKGRTPQSSSSPGSQWRAAFFASCLLSVLLSAPIAQGMAFDARPFCDRVLHQVPVDRWALLEYDVSAAGSADLPVNVPYSSDPIFAQDLKKCANLGQGGLPTDTAAAYNVFRFSPAQGQAKVPSRRLDFRMPQRLSQLSGVALDGNLALKLEVTEDGMVQAKDILFASDRRLGELVLDQVDNGLEIEAKGEDSGGNTYIDVLYMRFEAGRLVTLAQSHYVDQ